MIKEFSKSLSIYGILPIVGKFLGFFLVPLYIRLFDKTDYAAIELLLSSTNILTFLISLEIYSAVGRYYNEKDLNGQKKLISSGYWMTIISSIIIIIIGIILKKEIITILFNEYKYINEYYLALIWVLLSSYFTYFSVITRYKKKDKKYVIVSLISIIIRFLSTLLFVLILKTGISGVILGQIVGTLFSFILFYIDNKSLIIFNIDKNDFINIVKYCLPIVPGLLMVSLDQPIIRMMTSHSLSNDELANYSFAFRLCSIFTMISYAIQMAYKPYIFDKLNNNNYKNIILNISTFYESILYFFGCIFILFGNTLIHIIGTKSYYSSNNILGFIVWSQILSTINYLRGLAPEISKRTQYITIIEIVRLIILVIGIKILSPICGIYGIGVTMVISEIIILYINTYLSYKLLMIKYSRLYEIKSSIIILVCITLGVQERLIINILISIIVAVLLLPKEIIYMLKKYTYERI